VRTLYDVIKGVYRPLVAILGVVLTLNAALAQPKYRTFNQFDLAEKKAKAGKAIGSTACFVFRNDSTGITVNSLHVRLNSSVVAVLDSGGFTTIDISAKSKVVDLTGRTVAAGDSVLVCFKVEKKAPGTHANFWWWDLDGSPAGNRRGDLAASNIELLRTEPNGGNVREYLYKRVIRRPAGTVVGISRPDSSHTYGWIRYTTADRKYYPHSGPARCFDEITTGLGGTKDFLGELRNPHVKKHDNKLLGELHALKLAVVANDSGVTEPDTSTRFGDLIYNDAGNPGDICNAKTVRQIIHLADSALTYCASFGASTYDDLYTCIKSINDAFDGPYVADALFPLHLLGTHDLAGVPFMHPNPDAAPGSARRLMVPFAGMPEQVALAQNYPNPFNPTTMITFTLPEEALVTLKVYNFLGQEVATLLKGELMDDVDQSVEFDAGALSSGIYIAVLDVAGVDGSRLHVRQTMKMLLMK
jgi:hypothetical protein